MNPRPRKPMKVSDPRVAFAVHVFTACGAACAFMALLAAVRQAWPVMFVWLGIAVLIDGVDGTFARWLRVAEVLPRWSGDVLDLVVDILTYVFVPAYALAAGGLLPASLSTALGLLVAVTGSLYFADRQMKTPDYYFRGFPAAWNVAAFYLFVLRPPPFIGALAVVALAVLTFLPVRFIHPIRIPHMRVLTLAALVLWAGFAVYAVADNLAPAPWIVVALSLLGVYFAGVGLITRHHH